MKRLAFWATLHCLAGCAVGEVLGLAIGTVLGSGNPETIALAVGLASVFGYAFTVVPLVCGGKGWRSRTMVALAADTASITTMRSGVELQAVPTPKAPESDAVASTNASSARPVEEPETHPALIELHHKALAVRHLAQLAAARVPGESVLQAGRPY